MSLPRAKVRQDKRPAASSRSSQGWRIFPRSDREQALSEIARSVGEMAGLSRELLRSSMEGARQSTDQRSRIRDVVAMEERIRTFAEKSGLSSRETASRIEMAARDTERGTESIANTASQMQEMVAAVSASAELMRQFVLRVSEVDSMVATIGDIARQTNLLALNAAIEAANAGKKGDGFSVIAHEIRLLADRTSRSTLEIGERIETMCAAALETETAMTKGKVAIEHSIQQTIATRHSFRGLRDAMHRVESMAAEVAIASDRQISSVNRVTQSVQKIDDLSLGCTHEADASAEMSMRLAACTLRLHDQFARLGVPVERAEEYAQQDGREFLAKMATHQPSVDRAMELLRESCAGAGEPLLFVDASNEGAAPRLHFGETDAAAARPWLDAIGEETGCLGTLFVCLAGAKAQEQFRCIITSFKRSDGSRPAEIMLNPKGAAVKQLLAGLPYHGAAYVMGCPLLSAYEPIRSPSGDVIGALFVGYPLE